jgi:S1-C subfamily serine protease
MSGLEFKHSGMQWEKVIVRPDENLKNTSSTLEPEMNLFANLQYKFQLKPIFAIAYCRPNSPADLVGLKKEDIIIAINGKDALGFTLQSLNLLMKSEEGKEIKMTIERNGYKKDYVFTLEDPIKNH